MSQYVITDGSRFIYRNYANKYVPTSSEAMADIYTRKQAETIYNRSLPKALKSVFHLEKYDTPPQEIKQVNPLIPHNTKTTVHSDDVEHWINKISTLNGLADEALYRKDELTQQLRAVDQELSDIFHYIEFCNLNAAQGYKAYKMIKERRIKRRTIKNELEVVTAILNKKIGDGIENEISKIVDNLETRTYEPRILKELFD